MRARPRQLLAWPQPDQQVAAATAWRNCSTVSSSLSQLAGSGAGLPHHHERRARRALLRAWIALRYAIHAPSRVSKLVLLDPTDTFAPLSLRYRLKAIPQLAQPSSQRMRRFLAWETRGRPLDPAWIAVTAAGQDLGRAQIVMPRRPHRGELADLHAPVLVIVAGRSRAHDPARIARLARDRLANVTSVTLAQATHHSVPTEDAPETLRHIKPFLDSEN